MEQGLVRKPRMLVVDDEAYVRETLHRWFVIRGFDVDMAQTGLEAVEKCNSNSYDVITMDLEMPVMTGAEAISIIREKNPSVPILVLTGYVQVLDDNALHSVEKVLVKPVSLRKIEEEVRLLLGDRAP